MVTLPPIRDQLIRRLAIRRGCFSIKLTKLRLMRVSEGNVPLIQTYGCLRLRIVLVGIYWINLVFAFDILLKSCPTLQSFLPLTDGTG